MTENEAKGKWCPMTQYAINPENGFSISNRQNRVRDPWDSCLASDCMMWRSHGSGGSESFTGDECPDGEGWEKSETGRGKVIWLRPIEGRGYCGLAGKG